MYKRQVWRNNTKSCPSENLCQLLVGERHLACCGKNHHRREARNAVSLRPKHREECTCHLAHNVRAVVGDETKAPGPPSLLVVHHHCVFHLAEPSHKDNERKGGWVLIYFSSKSKSKSKSRARYSMKHGFSNRLSEADAQALGSHRCASITSLKISISTSDPEKAHDESHSHFPSDKSKKQVTCANVGGTRVMPQFRRHMKYACVMHN